MLILSLLFSVQCEPPLGGTLSTCVASLATHLICLVVLRCVFDINNVMSSALPSLPADEVHLIFSIRIVQSVIRLKLNLCKSRKFRVI